MSAMATTLESFYQHWAVGFTGGTHIIVMEISDDSVVIIEHPTGNRTV